MKTMRYFMICSSVIVQLVVFILLVKFGLFSSSFDRCDRVGTFWKNKSAFTMKKPYMSKTEKNANKYEKQSILNRTDGLRRQIGAVVTLNKIPNKQRHFSETVH